MPIVDRFFCGSFNLAYQMHEKPFHMRSTLMKKISMTGLAIALSIFIASGSYSYADIGAIRIDNEITADFEVYRFTPSFRYYYLGLENSPLAIAGVRRDYEFKDIEWTEVTPDSAKYKRIIELVKSFSESHPVTGARILNCQKDIIGSYYSGQSTGVVIGTDSKRLILAVQLPGSDRRP